jgi:glycosyltransferase involved in cell wall biosynthesis
MSRVLLISHDYVRRAMAGPAIRALELTRQLDLAGHDVTLAAPISTDLGPQPFRIETWRSGYGGGLERLARGQDVIVVQGFVLERNMFLLEAGARIVVDLYDPFHLEYMASLAHDPEANKVPDWVTVLLTLTEQVRLGDFFVCASERQRDFWLGLLSALNRVSPATYEADASLRNLIDVVPFGIPADPPRKRRPRIRGQVPGIGDDDFLLLWGGGIYNWFDPLTPIKAVARLTSTYPALKLFFLATRHPNPDVPAMIMARTAIDLARDLGVLDRHVFFSEDWVPYQERADWLLEASAGLSTHRDHLETRFSFRTRILDYFWANLPVLCTTGDSLADLVETEGLGLTLPPEDEDATVRAMVQLLDDGGEREKQSARVAQVARRFTWERAAQPLIRFCDNPHSAADRATLERPTDQVWMPLRSNAERAALAEPRLMVNEPASLPVRVARALRREGPAGVVRRAVRRLKA